MCIRMQPVAAEHQSLVFLHWDYPDWLDWHSIEELSGLECV